MIHKVLIVLALQRAGASLHPEDAAVRGGYIVSFNATGVAEGNFANAALDAFHRRVPVKELDAFDFIVLDPRKHHQVLQQGDAEPYAYEGMADINGPHVADWKVATFHVLAKGMTARDTKDLGIVALGGVDIREMAEEARGILWDETLRASGLRPCVEWIRNTELARAESEEPSHGEERQPAQERAQ